MTDNIIISAGNFTAEIHPGNLIAYQTLTKIRKFFKLMFSDPCKNAEAIKQMEGALNNIIGYTKADWHKASVDYQNKYQAVDTRGAFISANMQAKINRPPIMAVKHAKAKYERMLKIQASFLKYKGEN